MNLDPNRMLPTLPRPAEPDVPKTITSPLLGFVGAIAGLLVALAAIPVDPREYGALRVSAAAMSVGLMVSPAVCFFRSPRSMFRVEHLVMIGLIYWLMLDLLQGSISMFGTTPAGVQGAFVSIGLFAACFWAANLAQPFRLPRFIVDSTRHELTASRAVQIGTLCFGLAMFNYLFAANFDFELVAYALVSYRWFAPWSRGQLGGWDAFRDHLQYFGYILPTITALVAVKRGWFSPATFAMVVMSVVIIAFLSHGGSRRLVGVTLGSAILFYMLSNRRLTVRQTLLGGLAVMLLLLFLQLIFAYRNTGIIALYFQEELTITTQFIAVDDNFLRLAQVIDFFPERFPYVTYRRLYYTIVRPIPRVVWEDKPVNWGFDLAEALGDRGVAWSTSVIADWYVMYGLITVILGGFLYGRLCSWWSGVLDLGVRPVGLLIYSLGAMAIFCSLRQIDELLLMSYPLLGWFLVSSILLRGGPKAPAAKGADALVH